MSEFALSGHGLVEDGHRHVQGRPSEEETPISLLAGFRVHLRFGVRLLPPSIGLGLVEGPQSLVVLGPYTHEGLPAKIPQNAIPQHIGLLFDVDVVGLDDVDERKLDRELAEGYHASGPCGLLFKRGL